MSQLLKKMFAFTILEIIIFSFVGCDYFFDKSKIIGFDYRHFKDTPAWPLAKAARAGDTIEIETILNEKNINVDYQVDKGCTLLQMAVWRNNEPVVRTLLRHGADPNVYTDTLSSDEEGINAMCIQTSPYIYKLLLKYGGNPNSYRYATPSHKTSALNLQIGYNSIENVKLLVEAGVNIDIPATYYPLLEATTLRHYDIAYYLLQSGADFRKAKFIPITLDTLDVVDFLLEDKRTKVGTPQYNDKLKVISFLKQHGLDCDNRLTPEDTMKE